MRWIATELHCHTLHSDGQFTVEELLRAAKEKGCELIALTDHNTSSGCAELTEQLILETVPVIRGIEWTTFFGHMVVLAAREYIDWRFEVPETIDDAVQRIKAVGGTVGIAHPYVLGSPMCTGCYWDFQVKRWENIDYMEVWSGEFPSETTSNLRAKKLWLGLLDQGYEVAPSYGRDWHGPGGEDELYAKTWLCIEG